MSSDPTATRRALVIGNSDGIGLAVTERLLASGWTVEGISRRDSPVNDSSGGYVHHVADVADATYAETLAAIVGRMGPLDLCIYCAGIGDPVDVETLAGDSRVFAVNLIGAVATAGVVIPAMVAAGRGHLIGLSSLADMLANPTAPSYGASKAGLSSYLEGLALACRPRGVHVTNVRFGFVDTKMAKSPVRPFMISRSQAAERVMRCIERRPLRDTFPKRMALLLWCVRLNQNVRMIFTC